jgi:hypothetical protein
MISCFCFAGVDEDIATLKQKAEDFYTLNGRYFKGDWTPNKMPVKGETTSFSKIRKAEGETKDIIFTPTAKDWQYIVVNWNRKIVYSTQSGIAPLFEEGYRVIARQKDGTGKITEKQDGMFPIIGTPQAEIG